MKYHMIERSMLMAGESLIRRKAGTLMGFETLNAIIHGEGARHDQEISNHRGRHAFRRVRGCAGYIARRVRQHARPQDAEKHQIDGSGRI
jgi:hypothetical protein